MVRRELSFSSTCATGHTDDEEGVDYCLYDA